MKSFQETLDAFVQWGVMFAAAGTIGSWLGEVSWVLELTSHFRMQYAGVLILGACFWFLRRRPRAAVIAASFACINLALILPLYFRPDELSAHETPPLRLMQANVFRHNRDYDRLKRFIRDAKPDFVFLEEVDHRWMEALRSLKSDYPFGEAAPREDNFGIAFLSRSPGIQTEVVSLSKEKIPAIIAYVSIGSQKLTLIGAHPRSPINYWQARLRNEQLDELAQIVDRLEGPLVLAGDLNTTSWSPVFKRFLRTSRLRDSCQGFGIQPTWPAGYWPLFIEIDHCLVSPGIVIHKRFVGPAIGSDHYPLVVEFSLEASDKTVEVDSSMERNPLRWKEQKSVRRSATMG